mgnify:FL=1
MEHLQEILRVWADLHNKPSKTPKERQMMNELASILPRYGGGPVMQKMKVVRAGGELEPKEIEPVLRVARKAKDIEQPPVNIARAIENAEIVGAAIDEIIAGFEEKKSPQSSIDPEKDAEAKRARQAKEKE